MTFMADTQIQRLQDIMKRLRDPENGCPWDLEQSYETIAPYTLEEAYEVVDAIAEKDMPKLKDELGDLLLQVVFYAQMAREEGLFDFEDVAEIISEKMERRHPHIFGDVSAEDADAVLKNWEDIKAQERKNDMEDSSALAGVAKALPALTRAEKISKRAARVGFEWPDFDSLMNKVHEEHEEFRAEVNKNARTEMHEEFGDLLFATVNIARWQKIDPETALRDASLKFERRFRHMEQNTTMALSDMSDDEREALWDKAKQAEYKRKAG